MAEPFLFVFQLIKNLIFFGQDEYICYQCTLNIKHWVCPDEEQALLPKTQGMGITISAFVSREFGFGFRNLSKTELSNNKARTNKKYCDEEAAKSVFGNAYSFKPILTESLFVTYFEYGEVSNKEGYWDDNHMIVQIEDCIYCLNGLFDNKFNYLFLFDHSSGHAKKRTGGLDA